MKKRVLGLLLICCLLLTAGCGEKESEKSSSSSSKSSDSTIKEEEKTETNPIKTISCTRKGEKEEMDEDEDGNSIMGVQGDIAEYKYDTEKNELVEVSMSSYVEFEGASSDYISEQVEEAKSGCDLLKSEEFVKSCEVKKDSQKIEIYLTTDIDKLLEDDEDNENNINSKSTFEEIEKYVKENTEDEDTVCTVK